MPEVIPVASYGDLIHDDELDVQEADANVYRWRLDARVASAAERYDDPPKPGAQVTPCCHYEGFTNLRNGGFECGLCGEAFDEFHVVEEPTGGDA